MIARFLSRNGPGKIVSVKKDFTEGKHVKKQIFQISVSDCYQEEQKSVTVLLDFSKCLTTVGGRELLNIFYVSNLFYVLMACANFQRCQSQADIMIKSGVKLV